MKWTLLFSPYKQCSAFLPSIFVSFNNHN